MERQGVGFFFDPDADQPEIDLRFISDDGQVLNVSVDPYGHFDAYVFDRESEKITHRWSGSFGSIPFEQIARFMRPDMFEPTGSP